MALPVNKPTLDKTINDNILLNNNTQFITAKRLQDTLYPIVNSTFGLKTIWSGFIYCRRPFASFGQDGEDKTGVFVQERYYDKNYFPSLDPDSLNTSLYPLSSYQSEGCRYKITNVGAAIVNGEFTNVPTQIKNIPENPTFIGVGLTFDVKVEGGILRAIKVNNPGSGYCWGRYGTLVTAGEQIDFKSTIVELVLDFIGSGFRPEVTIDLSRVIDLDRGLIPNSVPSRGKALNLFIPNAGLSIGYGRVVSIGNFIGATSNIGFGSKIPIDACASDLNFNTFYPNVTNSPTIKGYYKEDFFKGSTEANQTSRFGYSLEIKVPIINTTLPA